MVGVIERARHKVNISNDELYESWSFDLETFPIKFQCPLCLKTVNVMNKTSLGVCVDLLPLPTVHDVETTSETKNHSLFSLAVGKLVI